MMLFLQLDNFHLVLRLVVPVVLIIRNPKSQVLLEGSVHLILCRSIRLGASQVQVRSVLGQLRHALQEAELLL